MRPDRVVVLPPPLDEHLGLKQRVERFPCQQLVAKLPVEVFHVAVPPRRAWFDEQRLYANSPQPLPHALSGELASVVATDVFRRTHMDEQIAQMFQHVLAREPLGSIDRQALPSELVHDCQPSASESVGHRRYDPRLGNSSRHDCDGSAAA